MGNRSLPKGPWLGGDWTDFDGLLEVYREDFEDCKKMDNTIGEIDFIKLHALPQFEDLLQQDEPFFPQKMAFKKIVDFLKSRVLELEGSQKSEEIESLKKNPEINSFKCEKYSPSKLFNAIKGELIDKNTIIEDFKNIFSGKPVNEITPVKWHNKGNASELLYFISQLMEIGFIPNEKRMNYRRLTGCFVKSDGSTFTENFKELKQSLDISLSPEKKLFIEKIIKKLTS
jgi:hypothetical protein